jgi:peptidoglycan/xylan/chitin deacetylase (PgdA/CDA1 family)
LRIIFVFLGAITYIGLQNYNAVRYQQLHPIIETRKSLVKFLPPDIKKEIKYASPSATFRVPILLYHYVEYVQNKSDKLRMQLNVDPNVLDSQIQTLQNAGYTFMTAKQLGDVLDGKAKMPVKPILLTFDDGHWDFETDVLPILEKYHVHATAYIITGFLGGSDFMTPYQLETVIKSGLVDVGAHTVHHLSLKGLPYTTVKYEIDQSKETLENVYHVNAVSFSYPNGSFDLQSVQLVKEAGFTTAVSTVPGIYQNQINRFFLYRLRPGYRTGQALLNFLNQSTFAAY